MAQTSDKQFYLHVFMHVIYQMMVFDKNHVIIVVPPKTGVFTQEGKMHLTNVGIYIQEVKEDEITIGF